MEVVDFFRQPEKFRKSGAKAPKGVLLVGPPGNGKTLMARAVAGESGVAFISSSASEFIEMYMGLGAARVRDLFNTARKLAPCIIFIDELDAVGRARRSGGAKGGNDERDNTVNQLLTEMDGFEAERAGIVVMGATNRKDVLDPALTRPGRFDRSIEVARPDFKGRLECIKVCDGGVGCCLCGFVCVCVGGGCCADRIKTPPRLRNSLSRKQNAQNTTHV